MSLRHTCVYTPLCRRSLSVGVTKWLRVPFLFLFICMRSSSFSKEENRTGSVWMYLFLCRFISLFTYSTISRLFQCLYSEKGSRAEALLRYFFSLSLSLSRSLCTSQPQQPTPPSSQTPSSSPTPWHCLGYKEIECMST